MTTLAYDRRDIEREEDSMDHDAGGRLRFHLPPELEAREPPEARGLSRDGVRMLVARKGAGELIDATFADLPAFLEAGDLVVVNTSGTIPAAVDATAGDGTRFVIHLSTQLAANRWVVELRRAATGATERWSGALPPEPYSLGENASLSIVEPYLGGRLWVADLELPAPLLTWIAAHGRPIHYGYVEHPWPLSAYQNVYATEPGSAEMPSAGRPFTPDVIMHLVAKGVGFTPLVLHTGVASLEADELPYPEHVTVPQATADRVNTARRRGRRVIAIGTTAVRGLESAVDEDGRVRAYDGWTDLVITPERGVRVIDGLLTGWHEPEASHLMMLEAIAGRPLLEASYAHGLAKGYRWHEFGDVHLILP
jgi:S-adenosylmethionine:tRNA ribosyltransferase-isomerase